MIQDFPNVATVEWCCKRRHQGTRYFGPVYALEVCNQELCYHFEYRTLSVHVLRRASLEGVQQLCKEKKVFNRLTALFLEFDLHLQSPITQIPTLLEL